MTSREQAVALRAGTRELAAGWRELGGKLVAYYLVRIRPHRRAARGGGDLVELVAETCHTDPRHAAFLLERLCYDHVRGLWRAGREPVRLLDGTTAAALPEQSLILLHAGLGMALTDGLLRPLLAAAGPASPANAASATNPAGRPAAVVADAAVDAALDRFAALVASNARPEYAPVSFEALGLMVRRFLPRLHPLVALRLGARDPAAAACYWHGAGRGIYFLARFFHPFPGIPRRGLAICRREAPTAALRLDAVAGYAFASTMINLERPELVARLLPHLAPGEIDALASGVAGALMTRHHTSPLAQAVRAFLRPLAAPPRGGEGDARLAALWESAVRKPALAALDDAYPRLRARGELASFARHQPLAAPAAPRSAA